MNQNGFRSIQLSGLNFWLTIFAIVWLLGAIGLGWLVKSLLIILALLIIAPVIGVFAFRWWLKRNLVEDKCPVCSTGLAGVEGMKLACPSCGEPLMVDDGSFQRITPPGTVDVNAVEVSAKQLED